MSYWYFWDATMSMVPARLPRWALGYGRPRPLFREAPCV